MCHGIGQPIMPIVGALYHEGQQVQRVIQGYPACLVIDYIG